MKRSIFVLVVLAFGFVSSANAEKGDQYWMLKAGLSFIDNSDSPDAIQSLNITYGYGITKAIAAEVDYQHSLGGGGYDNTDTNQKGEYSFNLMSIGAAYRHVFYEQLYARGKIAFAFGNDERTIEGTDAKTGEPSGVAGSLALGVLAGNVVGSSLTLELEYLKQPGDLSSILLGANVTF